MHISIPRRATRASSRWSSVPTTPKRPSLRICGLRRSRGLTQRSEWRSGHVILTEYHRDRQTPYFREYIRKYTDLPLLVRLAPQDDGFVPEQLLRAADFDGALGESNDLTGKPSHSTRKRARSSCRTGPSDSAGEKTENRIWKSARPRARCPSSGLV